MVPGQGSPRVFHVDERYEWMRGGGIETSIRNQRKALDRAGVPYTTDAEEEYDVIHVNVPGPVSLSRLLAAKARGVPVVVHGHLTAGIYKDNWRFSTVMAPLAGRYVHLFYRMADLMVAPSDYVRQLFRERGIDCPIRVVSNGVDEERFGREQQVADTSLDSEGEQVVLMVGGVQQRKGVGTFLQVAQRLPQQDFRWVGDKTDSVLPRSVRRRISEAPSNACFTGYVEDVREAFGAADVFFFPTRHESQGIALLEAAYCGLPLVVRDIPVYRGWLEDGVHCLKADGVEGFVDALERLREDAALRERLGGNARAMAEQHTLDTVGEELRQVYEAVTADHR